LQKLIHALGGPAKKKKKSQLQVFKKLKEPKGKTAKDNMRSANA
jgi:hypothetical protein